MRLQEIEIAVKKFQVISAYVSNIVAKHDGVMLDDEVSLESNTIQVRVQMDSEVFLAVVHELLWHMKIRNYAWDSGIGYLCVSTEEQNGH